MKSLIIVMLVAACGGSSSPKFSVDKLEDPATCMQCHQKHYTEWSGSMHAYASDDPVFLAMNKRGQRETGGQLGTFCVQCHAPMAVALGLTDGTNFDPTQLPPTARGITCYFCHDVDKVAADHNNGLQLALDDTMRGGVHDPTDSPAHNSMYDKTMDSHTNKSTMCGSCHDVTTPKGIKLERTYAEWQGTIFAMEPTDQGGLTCSGCHMQSDPSTSIIADGPAIAMDHINVKSRKGSFHEHMWLGVDEQLTPFAPADVAAAQDMAIHRDLDYAITVVGPTKPGATVPASGGICLTPENGGEIKVRIDTRGPGHMWPSGAAQDRRAWLEVIAYDASNAVLFSSGVVADGQDPAPSPGGFWDRTFKADMTPAHFFWDVDLPAQSNLLKPPTTLDQNSQYFDHSTTVQLELQGQLPAGKTYADIDHISARVQIRPLGYDILNDLASSGDLDPSIIANIKTYDLPATDRHWMRAEMDAGGCEINPNL